MKSIRLWDLGVAQLGGGYVLANHQEEHRSHQTKLRNKPAGGA